MGTGQGKAEANAAVLAILEDEIARGRETGVQVAAYRDGEIVIDCWAGMADVDADRPVDGDTLFNVFSVAKAVVALLSDLFPATTGEMVHVDGGYHAIGA